MEVMLPVELRELAEHLPAGSEAWLVGGAVRDLLLGRPLVDLDLAVPRGALALARHLAGALDGAFVPLDTARGVARVVWERHGVRLEVDVADFRAAGLEADLRARDLTINAMALAIGGAPRLVDPSGGRRDLDAGVIRLLGPEVLADDPLRGLRAVRFASQLGFRLDETSAGWIGAAAPQLATVAPERQRDELWKALVAAAEPAATLRQLARLGLLAVLLPEAVAAQGVAQSPPHRHDVWEHTLAVVARLAEVLALVERLAAHQPRPGDGPPQARAGHPAAPAAADPPAGELPAELAAALGPFAAPFAGRLARPLAAQRPARGHLLLAALFHDLGKPPTRSLGADGRLHFYGHEQVGARLAEARLSALRFGVDEVQWVAGVVRHHMRPLQLRRAPTLSRRALHRFHRAAGEVAPEVCLLSLADNLAKGGERASAEWPALLDRVVALLDAYFFRHAELVAPARLLTGDQLIELLDRPPGPWVGELLRELAEAQAAGEVDDREGAERLARHWSARRERAGAARRETAAPGGQAGNGGGA